MFARLLRQSQQRLPGVRTQVVECAQHFRPFVLPRFGRRAGSGPAPHRAGSHGTTSPAPPTATFAKSNASRSAASSPKNIWACGMRRISRSVSTSTRTKSGDTTMAMVLPQALDRLAEPGFRDDVRLHAEAQPLHARCSTRSAARPSGPSAWRHVAGKAHEAARLGREEMAQRRFERGGGTTQQVRQAFLASGTAQAARQVDPVPGLFKLIVGQAAVRAGVRGFGRRRRCRSRRAPARGRRIACRPQTRLDLLLLAAFEHHREAPLGRLHRLLVDLAGLEDLEVLADHRREAAIRPPPRRHRPAQEEAHYQQRRQREEESDNGQDHHGGTQSFIKGGLSSSHGP